MDILSVTLSLNSLKELSVAVPFNLLYQSMFFAVIINAIVYHMSADFLCDFFQFIGTISHCNTMTNCFQHFQIVISVSKCYGF